jgi:D-arabinose 1-dehydrogenase-like Zn-dependent alcohol dehydrogenase
VCYSDYKTSTGHMPFSEQLRLPHVAGHEIAGQVVEAGEGATLQTGQRVVVYNYWACGLCRSCRAGEETVCLDLRGWVGFTSPGGFQEYLCVPHQYALPLPDSIADEHAAALSCATGTSYRAIVTRGRVAAGEWVLIVGAGGVGLQAVQIARAAGARVLAVDVDERKLERARACGATATLAAGPGTAAWVRDMTGGGADLVVDAAGRQESLAVAADTVRPGGRVVMVGYAVGETRQIPSGETVLGEVSYIGTRYVKRDELMRAIDLAGAGLIQPAIDSVLDLEAANEALARLVSGDTTGRLVLRVARDGA